MHSLYPTLEGILNLSKDFLLVSDHDFNIIGASYDAREYLGIHELKDVSFETLYVEDLEPFRQEVLQVLQGLKEELLIKIVDLYGIHHTFEVKILKIDNMILFYHFLVSSKDSLANLINQPKNCEGQVAHEMISLDNKLGEIFRKANKKLLQFEKLFSMMPVIAAIIQYDGHIQLMNSSWEELLGYTEVESLQRPFYENIHPEDYEYTMDSLENIKKTGGNIHSLVNRFRCKNGKYKWLSWSMSIDKKHKLLYAAAFDVSKQKKSEEQLHKHQDLLNVTGLLANVGGWEYEIDSMNMTWTREMFSIYGMKGNQPLSLQEQVERFDDNASIMFQSAIKNALKNGEAWDLELPLKMNDGTEIWIRTIGKAENYDGSISKLFGAMQNISAYKNLESSLKQAMMEAQNANRSKTEFLANISHEIRTPITSILGYTDMLQENISNNREKKYLQIIKIAGSNLLQLMEDLIDMSSIETGKLKIRYDMMDIYFVLHEIQSMFEQRGWEKGLQIKMTIDESMPRFILLDEVRVRQVLSNLTGNAIKFTEKGTVRIRAKVHKIDQAKASLTFIVEDTGIGIPKDQILPIFEPFRQMDGQNNRKYGGTGLGLSISKHLVELMNGELRVESDVGKGSKFIVYFGEVFYECLRDATNSNMRRRKIITNRLPKGDSSQAIHLPKKYENDSLVVSKITDEFFPRYKKLKTAMIMDHVKIFANDIREFSLQYDIMDLANFGNRLEESAKEYNIRDTIKMLDEFLVLVEQLVKQQEEPITLGEDVYEAQ